MDQKRVLQLNKIETNAGESVIYCMSRDQRVNDNHALLAAQDKAIELKLPLLVVFNLRSKTGVRAREHYNFMIAGLREVEQDLRGKMIDFVATQADTAEDFVRSINDFKPAALYFDFAKRAKFIFQIHFFKYLVLIFNFSNCY
jgi:deoxyribodipyrimidine photo-lyase